MVDPFAGAGTIPLESALQGRRAFGADISPYAKILSLAKLFPPPSLDDALEQAKEPWRRPKSPTPDLRTVPVWVRQFFHPDTLREALNFAVIARRPRERIPHGVFFGNPAPPTPWIFFLSKQPPCSLSAR